MITAAADSFFSKKIFGRSVGGLLLFTIMLAVWVPCLGNDFVDWDDLDMIVHNPRFEPPTLAGVGWYWTHRAWNLYQPMTTTLWAGLAAAGWHTWTDHFGGHLNPAVFHLAGVLLHTSSTLLLFALFQRLCCGKTAAMAGALIFGVHPFQVEPVVFIGAVNNPLAGFFSLLAITQYLAVTDPRASLSERGKAVRSFVGSLSLLLALLSKPTAVVVPPIAFALDWAFHRRSIGPSVRSILPWCGLVLPCVMWTKAIQHGHDLTVRPISTRPLIAADTITFYLHKIAWPARLCIDYGRSPDFVLSHGMGYLALIVPFILVMIAIACAWRWRAVSAAIAIFLVGLLPNSGLLPFDSQLISTVCDRYAYFAMIGIALLGAAAVKNFPAVLVPAAILIVILTVRVEQQIHTWANGETMFRQALLVNPDSWMSDMMLGKVLADRKPDEATQRCERSIALRPDSADPWNTIGTIRFARGDHAGAIQAFTQACELAPLNEVFQSNLRIAEAARQTKVTP